VIINTPADIRFVVFFRLREKPGWSRVVLMMGCGIGLLLVMAGVLKHDFPPGLLQSFLDLSWPFR
jgi:hypothetical protein